MIRYLIVFIILISGDLYGQNLRLGNSSSISESHMAIMIGEDAGQVVLPRFINSSQSSKLEDFKGKIVILEFWATWCGPCLPAMEHLAELKNKFSDQLEVIAISYESEDRVKRYISNKPLPLLHVSDEEGKLKDYFRHYKIPHSVIINGEGKVVAYTTPEEITDTIIDQVLAGDEIDILIKEDEIRQFDYTKDYFPPAPGTKKKFFLQPEMPGGVPLTRRVSKNNSEYQDRRITILNQSLYNIYKQAFGIESDSQLIIEKSIAEEIKEQIYCVEVISPSPETFLSTFQEGLTQEDMPYEAILETREIPVIELEIKDGGINLKESIGERSISGTQFTRINQYNGINKTIDDFVEDYLNKYLSNTVGKPFVNGTNLKGKYDFDFSFEPENPSSFKEEINKLGFELNSMVKMEKVLLIRSKE